MLTRIVAEFQEYIVPAIPMIIALLVNKDEGACWKAAESLKKFVEQGKVPSLVIAMADNDCS